MINFPVFSCEYIKNILWQTIMQNKYTVVKNSNIHGDGVYAKRDIPTDTLIIQYIGEKISKIEAESRASNVLASAKKHGTGAVYLFELDEKYDIDGNVPWNTARLINHACETNCEAQMIGNEIWIVATENIKKNEELYYDYGYDLSDWREHPCYCGKPSCVGYIIEKRYRKKIQRILKAEQSRQK